MAAFLDTLRRRRLAVAGVLLAVATVVGALVGWRTTAGFEGRYVVPPAGAPLPTGAAGPVPPPVGAPVAVAPPPAPAPVVAEEDAPDDEDADRIAGAIERTTRKALRRGEAVRWHKAGEEGYVTVGPPSDDGDRVCRNVAATITTAGGQTQSSSHLWCSDDGDDWAPAP